MAGEGLFFSSGAGGILHCSLCPHRCAIADGFFGACGVRGSKGGEPLLPFYGHVAALAADPVEKKPLYHFRPGSSILSAGFVGCSLRCPFCQNWRISQPASGSFAGAPGKKMTPGELVSAALRENAASPDQAPAIAYTYSEPLVHAEFLLDCMALAHKNGIANVLVTNGCASGQAAEELLSLTDAANIDLKCFSAETYAQVLGGGGGGGGADSGAFDAALAFIRRAFEKGVHVEITTLVVPGLNDSLEELGECANFIASVKKETPWHLSAYHPDYRWNAPPTDPALLLHAARRARDKLPFVYTGNIAAEKNDTPCLHCGALAVRRRGYRIDASGLAPPKGGGKFFRCAACGEETAIAQ